MARCALTLYWPEGAAAPQDTAAPLLGWAWASRCGARCTVVAGTPAAPGCSGAQVQCVGEWLPHETADAKRRPTATGASAEAFVSVSTLCAGAPSALELWLGGARAPEVDLVVVLYKARTREPRGLTSPQPYEPRTAQVPLHGRCALLSSGVGVPEGESDLDRALCCIGACAAHTCGVPACAATAHPPPPLLSGAALRTLRTAQCALHSAPAGLPPLANVSAVAREVAARLGSLHDVAARKLRPHVALASVVFDVLLGLAAGAALLANSASIEAAVRHTTAMLLMHLPLRGALWLMGAKPLGIKLHEPLCLALGEAILYCASVCEVVSDAVALGTPRAVLWLARAGALGFSLQAALLSDILALTMLPLAAQRMATRAWLALHLAGIRNLWRKLYRPAALREAAAARPAGAGGLEAYRVERLTIGTLLLTPLLLLAPTLAAFGLLVSLLSAAPFTARLLLRHAPAALRSIPRGLLASFPRRNERPQLTKAAWFQPLPRNAGALVLRLYMT